ncbi:MAG: arylsulfatase [Flavicella sp.]
MLTKQQTFYFLLLSVCFFQCKGQATKQTSNQKPNIIYILADDLGYGDVGFNGQQKIKTPTLDKMAKDGITFSQHYAGSAVCGPSRVSLMTGLHAGHSSVRANPKWTKSGLPVDFKDEEITIAESLKKAGYRTGIVGKWALAENLAETQPNNQGFDYFFGFNKHISAHHYYPEEIWENKKLVKLPNNNTKAKKGAHVQELFTQKAIEFIKREHKNNFFLYLPFTTPHYELTLPEKHKTYYRKKGWPLRKMKSKHYYNDPDGHVTYAAMVSKMDKDIQRIYDTLELLHIADNTLVIFTSDNGHEYDQTNNEFFNSNGPFRGKKRDVYEGGIRVPFVATWPGHIKKGTSSNHASAFWDVKATFCELTGVELEGKTDGVSFLPVLIGDVKKQKKHDYLYWEMNERAGPIQALQKGDWKLIYFKSKNKYELYNLERDPSEKQNVVASELQVFENLKKTLVLVRNPHPEFPLEKKKIKKTKNKQAKNNKNV